MKYAVSNIALPSYRHESELWSLQEIGFEGLEVAPSRVWENTRNITFAQIEAYRRSVEQAGLRVVGLHSLFYDRPDLGIFLGGETPRETAAFMVWLAKVCSDLGGKTLVFGSPAARKRGSLSLEEADEHTIAFFTDVCRKAEAFDVCFVIEALGRSESDYIHSVYHAKRIADAVNSRALMCHFDAKAMVEAQEVNEKTFKDHVSQLAHFHANDPDLGVLGKTKEVNHELFGSLLRETGYSGYVSVEQKMINPSEPLSPVRESFSVLERCYY